MSYFAHGIEKSLIYSKAVPVNVCYLMIGDSQEKYNQLLRELKHKQNHDGHQI